MFIDKTFNLVKIQKLPDSIHEFTFPFYPADDGVYSANFLLIFPPLLFQLWTSGMVLILNKHTTQTQFAIFPLAINYGIYIVLDLGDDSILYLRNRRVNSYCHLFNLRARFSSSKYLLIIVDRWSVLCATTKTVWSSTYQGEQYWKYLWALLTRIDQSFH